MPGDMLSSFIHYGQSKIHYLHYSNGPENIICLHGYGESAASFNSLIVCLPSEFSLIAIDLPYHGKTEWNENRAFTIADIVVILSNIFKALNITEQHFILIGYSMGGRIAMSLIQHIPEKVSRVILLAPDGMKVNFWYWLSTQTKIGNRLFRFTMKNPQWLLKLIKISHRFKFINKSIFKFIVTYIADNNVRTQLFNRWICMRAFKPNIKKIRKNILENQLPVRMLYGRHDRIILAERARRLSKGLETLCTIHIIDGGHQVLQQKHTSIIINLLTT